MSYVSSIIKNYGDEERVKSDILVLRDIIDRQGSKLLTDVIAEKCGETANKFNMTDQERSNVMNALLHDFNSALNERL